MPAITVKNQGELDAAIKTAKGGDTILLAPGTYSSVTMTNIKPATVLTIQSLDAKNPAVVQSLWISSSNNITFKNLDVKREVRPAEDWATASRILNSNNITVDGVRFSGGTGDPSDATGIGLSVRTGTNIKFLNSSIDHFALGMDMRDVTGVVVRGNNFHDNRRDHTNFSEADNVVIDSNTFTGLYPINDEHPDAIQFGTLNRTKGSSNITITNNVVMQGDGRGTQGIFLNEEDGNLPYKNVTIQNNMIYLSGMYHGINVVNGSGVNIKYNTVVSVADERSNWIRVERVTSGTVANNLADDLIVVNSPNIGLTNNVTLMKDSVMMRNIPDLNAGANARLAGLIVKGIGYSPPAGSTAAARVTQELASAPILAATKLLLDLNFTQTGVVDYSQWSTDEPVKPADVASISNGMYRVQTGAGLELNRSTSRQLYSLSAFTLNFNLKRDAGTAAVGQVIGVYNSWNISLRADGELAFTMTNTAGKTFSIATKGAKITDANLHKIALTYDSARGTASIYVDGVAKGSGAVSGTTPPQTYYGLYLGSPFSAAFSGSLGDIEVRDTALSAAQILALNAASTTTSTAQAAETLKASVAKGVASAAVAALASNSPATATAMTLPTLTLAAGSTGGSSFQSPLAQALASANPTSVGSLPNIASPMTTSWFRLMDAFHA